MSDAPIRLGLRAYIGPCTVAGLTHWFGDVLDDQVRVLETNLLLAVVAGDTDLDSVDATLDEAQRMCDEALTEFRQGLAALVQRVQSDPDHESIDSTSRDWVANGVK